MQTKLLEPCGECRDCYFLNSGIKEGLLAFFNGDYRGLGIMEFYFEKILDYRPDMEDLNHMLAYCRDCTQQTIFNKAPYEEILSALRDIESIMDDLSDEEKGLFIMEIRNSPKVERLMKIYG